MSLKSMVSGAGQEQKALTAATTSNALAMRSTNPKML
jgi:hypothetical protein